MDTVGRSSTDLGVRGQAVVRPATGIDQDREFNSRRDHAQDRLKDQIRPRNDTAVISHR